MSLHIGSKKPYDLSTVVLVEPLVCKYPVVQKGQNLVVILDLPHTESQSAARALHCQDTWHTLAQSLDVTYAATQSTHSLASACNAHTQSSTHIRKLSVAYALTRTKTLTHLPCPTLAAYFLAHGLIAYCFQISADSHSIIQPCSGSNHVDYAVAHLHEGPPLNPDPSLRAVLMSSIVLC